MNKKLVWFGVIVLASFILLYIKTEIKDKGFFCHGDKCIDIKDDKVVCTADAKQCPDGSFVGREGKDCSFKTCKNIIDNTDKTNLIKVSNLVSGQKIKSPFIVNGEARGYWFFEGSFVIKVLDDKNQELGTFIATAKDEWMTENFVSFSANLNFTKPINSKNGFVVFLKENPSDLPENDDSLIIPVIFE